MGCWRLNRIHSPCTFRLVHAIEMGPVTCLKLNDCTLPRIGQDATITTRRIFIGQDVETHVAQLLMDFHAPAYERAKEQDAQVVAAWAR